MKGVKYLGLILCIAGFVRGQAPVVISQPKTTEDIVRQSGIQGNARPEPNAIVRADDELNLKDSAELLRLATAINDELRKNGQGVLSLKTLKKVEDAERISRAIKQRMKRR